MMPAPLPASRLDPDLSARIESAAVIFVAQDGFRLAPARVRCYSFAKLLNQKGLRAEVLSFFDHLGAADQGGPVIGVPVEDKLRLNVAAYDLLARNPRAVLYVQKAGYHALACLTAAARNGNPIILDYDDYDLESQSFRDIEPWLPCLAPDRLLAAVASRAQACVVSSRRILDLVAPHNPNTHLIHTVADQDVFSPHARNAPRARYGGAVNVLWCGDVWGHVPMKDLFFALDAFTLVPGAVRRKARFHIIGFGRAWDLTKQRVRLRYAGIDNLVLHDFVPPAEMPAVFREMDIGVLPYHENAFNLAKSPTKMFEYMLTKVAVLATPVGEVVHCLEDERSVLLASGLDSFAGALARLIDDDALRRTIAEAAYERALAEYSLQGVGDRLVAIVRAATASPAACEAAAPAGPTLEAFMARALGRRLSIAPREVELARRDLQALAASKDLDAEDPRRWSAPLLAMLDWPGLARREGIAPERLAELRMAGGRLRNAAKLRPRLRHAAMERPAGPPRLCKLAAAEDWEYPSWFAWLGRFKTNCASFQPSDAGFGTDVADLENEAQLNQTYSYFKRSRGAWERVQLLYGLDRLGLLDGTARMLVAATDVDGFYLMLTEHAAHVDVVDLGRDAEMNAARVAAGKRDPWLLKPRQFDPDRLTIHHGPIGTGTDMFEGRTWDAVVVVQNALARADAAAFLNWAGERLRPGGVLAFSVEVRLDDGFDVSGLPAQAATRGDAEALLGGTGAFVPVDGFDASLDDATLDRLVVTGGPDSQAPHFISQTGDTLHTTSVWFYRRT